MTLPVRKLTSEPGTSEAFAKEDHAHDVETAAPKALTFGGGAEGSSTALARADHVHPCPAPPAPAIVTKAPAEPGKSEALARADHKHDVQTAAPVGVTYGAASEGTATSLARADHVHPVEAPGSPASITGVGNTGNSAAFARADHTHPIEGFAREDHAHDHGVQPGGQSHSVATAEAAGFMSIEALIKLAGIAQNAAAVSSEAPLAVGTTASAGQSSHASRVDHVHAVKTAAPGPIGSNASEGTSEALSRADHIHPHGDLPGGGAHALATDTENGFMSSEDRRTIARLSNENEQLKFALERMRKMFKIFAESL